MTRLNVCCALITLSSAHGPLLLAAKKACGQPNGLLYEFPGGKLEAGEDARDAIVREIREELGCAIRPLCPLGSRPAPGERPDHTPYPVSVRTGERPPAIPLEHESLGFFSSRSLPSLPWAPADLPILKEWLDRNAR